VSGDDYVVPAVLRAARFVPRQAPGRRQPAQVTPGAFRAAGLPVPENPAQRNVYQLTRRQGLPWSPGIDSHVRRRGAELLGGDRFVCVDCDTALAVDGTVWLDGFRRLADMAAESGDALDLLGCIAARTPGNGTHGQGWHLWFLADAGRPVRFGPLSRCPLIEVRPRATAPGSPGYVIRSAPDGEPDVLPRWLAELAGPPRAVTAGPGSGSGRGHRWERLEGILHALTDAGPGDHRNSLLYWSACRCGEMVAPGVLDAATAERVLYRAAEENGHVAKHGPAATTATIQSGLRTVVPA
jgi:hypothetical protein